MSSRYQSTIDVSLPNNTHAALVRLVGEGQRVLELGAASGYMTAVLKERGCTVTAVEFDPEATERLEAVADQTIIGDLNDPSVITRAVGPFDVVLAGDVFEHLLDPEAALRAAIGKLTPQGRVVLSVPNVAHVDVRLSLLQGRFDYTETGLLDRTHVRFFTYSTLLSFVADAGMLPERLERIRSGVFETELKIDPRSVPARVLDEVVGLPEASTYQFVLAATRDDGDPERRDRIAAEFLAAGGGPEDMDLRLGESYAEQLELVRGYLAGAEADREAARARVQELNDELDRTVDELATARGAVVGLEAEIQVARRELVAACAGESRRTAMEAEIAGLTQELIDARGASGDRMDPRSVADIVRDLNEQVQTGQVARSELAEIKRSRGYRAVNRYRAAVERLAPSGTRRRQILNRLRPSGH